MDKNSNIVSHAKLVLSSPYFRSKSAEELLPVVKQMLVEANFLPSDKGPFSVTHLSNCLSFFASCKQEKVFSDEQHSQVEKLVLDFAVSAYTVDEKQISSSISPPDASNSPPKEERRQSALFSRLAARVKDKQIKKKRSRSTSSIGEEREGEGEGGDHTHDDDHIHQLSQTKIEKNEHVEIFETPITTTIATSEKSSSDFQSPAITSTPSTSTEHGEKQQSTTTKSANQKQSTKKVSPRRTRKSVLAAENSSGITDSAAPLPKKSKIEKSAAATAAAPAAGPIVAAPKEETTKFSKNGENENENKMSVVIVESELKPSFADVTPPPPPSSTKKKAANSEKRKPATRSSTGQQQPSPAPTKMSLRSSSSASASSTTSTQPTTTPTTPTQPTTTTTKTSTPISTSTPEQQPQPSTTTSQSTTKSTKTKAKSPKSGAAKSSKREKSDSFSSESCASGMEEEGDGEDGKKEQQKEKMPNGFMAHLILAILQQSKRPMSCSEISAETTKHSELSKFPKITSSRISSCISRYMSTQGENSQFSESFVKTEDGLYSYSENALMVGSVKKVIREFSSKKSILECVTEILQENIENPLLAQQVFAEAQKKGYECAQSSVSKVLHKNIGIFFKRHEDLKYSLILKSENSLLESAENNMDSGGEDVESSQENESESDDGEKDAGEKEDEEDEAEESIKGNRKSKKAKKPLRRQSHPKAPPGYVARLALSVLQSQKGKSMTPSEIHEIISPHGSLLPAPISAEKIKHMFSNTFNGHSKFSESWFVKVSEKEFRASAKAPKIGSILEIARMFSPTAESESAACAITNSSQEDSNTEEMVVVEEEEEIDENLSTEIPEKSSAAENLPSPKNADPEIQEKIDSSSSPSPPPPLDSEEFIDYLVAIFANHQSVLTPIDIVNDMERRSVVAKDEISSKQIKEILLANKLIFGQVDRNGFALASAGRLRAGLTADSTAVAASALPPAEAQEKRDEKDETPTKSKSEESATKTSGSDKNEETLDEKEENQNQNQNQLQGEEDATAGVLPRKLIGQLSLSVLQHNKRAMEYQEISDEINKFEIPQKIEESHIYYHFRNYFRNKKDEKLFVTVIDESGRKRVKTHPNAPIVGSIPEIIKKFYPDLENNNANDMSIENENENSGEEEMREEETETKRELVGVVEEKQEEVTWKSGLAAAFGQRPQPVSTTQEEEGGSGGIQEPEMTSIDELISDLQSKNENFESLPTPPSLTPQVSPGAPVSLFLSDHHMSVDGTHEQRNLDP